MPYLTGGAVRMVGRSWRKAPAGLRPLPLKTYQAALASNTKASAAKRSPGLFFAPRDAVPSFDRDKVEARIQPELTVHEYGGTTAERRGLDRPRTTGRASVVGL